jgi:uncharacterized repeat protein (TIGR01451 family)
VYDLALKKTISSTTPGPFKTNDRVTFDIIVYNQGDINAANIEITDYIPTGLELADSAWTQSGSTAKRTISSIVEGSSQAFTISFKIMSTTTQTIYNFAEISQDDGADCDSIPDTINGNQSGESEASGLIDNSL